MGFKEWDKEIVVDWAEVRSLARGGSLFFCIVVIVVVSNLYSASNIRGGGVL